MARGGINKVVVQKARQALLARGEHPSIDAVRIELGNTGSKTTIHRYLKELESLQPSTPLTAPNLSAQLGSLVEQLATQLEEEGNARIDAAEGAFNQARDQLQTQLDLAQQALAAAHLQLESQAKALAAESAELASSRSALQAEQQRSASLNQSLGELQLRLADKGEQVRSLEEKHQHARDALEHYRSASRDQREQDQRRHEAQVQQLQVEQRQLQQGLIVKQDELTRLHRDNERLVVEARQRDREIRQRQAYLEQRDEEIQSLTTALAQLQGARDELLRQLGESRAQQDAQRRLAENDQLRLEQLHAELHACAEALRESQERPVEEATGK